MNLSTEIRRGLSSVASRVTLFRPLFNLEREGQLTWAVIALMGLVAPALAFSVYIQSGLSLLFWTVGAISAAAFAAGVLQWKQQGDLAVRVLIYTMFFGSMLGIVSHGSVRSTAVLGVMGALIGAGIFLKPREMALLGALSVVGLGLLNMAEMRGMMGPADLSPGLSPWLVQTLVLLILLVGIYIGRGRLARLFQHWEDAVATEKQLTKKLRASEARARALLEYNPLACVVQDALTLKVLDVNEAFSNLFGIDKVLMIQQRPPNLWQDKADAKRFWSAMKTQGRVNAMSATGLRQNGSTFDGQVYSELVAQADGNLLITMVLDITDQKEALRALERSRERFSKAFRSCPMGMTIIRISNDRVLEINEAITTAMGYNRQDVLGQPSSKAMNWVQETERTTFWQMMRGDQKVDGFEATLWDKSGNQVEVKLWADLINIDGEPCALIYTMDITEERRRESTLINLAKGVSSETGELFFHSLVEQMADTLHADLVLAGETLDEATIQSIAVHQNRGPAPNLRYAVDDAPCRHTMKTLSGSYATQQLNDRFPSAYSEEGPSFSSYLGVPLKDHNGANIGILNALWKKPREIDRNTEAMMTIFASRCGAELLRTRQDRAIVALRETLEQRVAERTEQLSDLNKELDSFAYSVSHDLKTPLRSIEGFMHLLRERTEGRLEREDVDLMERVMGASNRMAQLIKDLLALARVSQTELQRKQVDITALARDIVEKLRDLEPARDVEVSIASGLTVDCDPHLARIALENLLGNAWKYTQKNPKARIELANMDAATGSSTLYVKDNGAGFDMSRSERLFKAFQRLHGANEFEGSGIGLATVRRITDRHGGHIRGEGAVGVGATFQFSFGVADPVWPALSAGSSPALSQY